MAMREIPNYCQSPEEELRSFTNRNSLEFYLWRYLFPPVFLIGILGNVTELFVLFSPGMRNRANNLLSAMAFSDIAFLLFLLPHSFANYSPFALNYSFRFAYFRSKHELVALANWSSAAAIWFVLIVCVDRLRGIKSPLYSCKEWKSKNTCLLLFGIVVATGLLTSSNHFAYECFHWRLCNGTQVHTKCFSVAAENIWLKNQTNPTPQWVRNFVRMGTTLHSLFGIILPTIALIALNVTLVYELRKRSNQPLLPSEEILHHRNIQRPSAGAVQRRQERRVTITVCAIVCCFILTQGPSSVFLLWNWLGNGFNKVTNPKLFDICIMANFLPAIGKSSNFFLFCFISSSFRKRLFTLLRKKRKQSSMLTRLREFSSRRLDSNRMISAKSKRSFAKTMSTRSQAVVSFRNGSVLIKTSCANNDAGNGELSENGSMEILVAER